MTGVQTCALPILFKVGDKLAIHGKVDYYGGFTITHPEFDKLEKDDDPVSTGKVIPLYPLTQELKSSGLDQRILRNLVHEALSLNIEISELFSDDILLDNDLISLKKALHDIHFSEDRKSTRLNSSHALISYAVFCLKKKKKHTKHHT
mgnify:CR=1 FL=1